MTAKARPLLALSVAAALVAGCFLPGNFDWMFVVQNSTGRDVYLRAKLSTDADEYEYRVDLVPAGASGRSVEWYGHPETVIEVLDHDCHVLGTMETTSDTSEILKLDALPGLTGHVDRYHFNNANDNLPIEATGDCDGFLYL
jgi:hypothetical protein